MNKANEEVLTVVKNQLNKLGVHYEGTTIYDKDTTGLLNDYDDYDCKLFNDPSGHCDHPSHAV